MKKIKSMDILLPRAAIILIEENNGIVSTTVIQRRLGLGYPRAALIVDQMLDMEIFTDFETKKILVTYQEIEEEFPEYLTDDLSVHHRINSFAFRREQNARQEVNDLHLQSLQILNEDGTPVDNNEIADIRATLEESLTSSKFVINCDYSDLKKFVTKNKYVVKLLKLPFNFKIEEVYVRNLKLLSTFCIVSMSNGTDFSTVIDLSNKIQGIFKKSVLVLKVVENEDEVGIKILYPKEM